MILKKEAKLDHDGLDFWPRFIKQAHPMHVPKPSFQLEMWLYMRHALRNKNNLRLSKLDNTNPYLVSTVTCK
jgi:hypothetical protein